MTSTLNTSRYLNGCNASTDVYYGHLYKMKYLYNIHLLSATGATDLFVVVLDSDNG